MAFIHFEMVMSNDTLEDNMAGGFVKGVLNRGLVIGEGQDFAFTVICLIDYLVYIFFEDFLVFLNKLFAGIVL